MPGLEKSDRGQVRHRDPQLHVLDYRDQEVLVVCPACGGCASLEARPIEAEDAGAAGRPRRLTCAGCGHTGSEAKINPRLWLSLPCCGETLWAYNHAHLAELRAYVAAGLRERATGEVNSLRNGTMINRLPKWLKSRKNREAILKAIDKLAAT